MSKVPNLDDVRKALSAVKGSTFHIDGGLVYIYHTILHDENHPVDLRYNNTNLYIQIKQGVSYSSSHEQVQAVATFMRLLEEESKGY
jgi:hypothetical protein